MAKLDRKPNKVAKRFVRVTVRGTVNGYIGGKFAVCLGERSSVSQIDIDAFLAGGETDAQG